MNSVDLWVELIELKSCQKNWIKRSKIGKAAKSPNFAENQLSVTFSIFVSEIQKNTNKN